MKSVLFALLLELVACKPDPVAKPAEGSAAAPAASAPAARAPGPRPTLPDETAGSDAPAPPPAKRPPADKDGDGVVSPEERDAARAERATRIRDRFDANHDGKLTPAELAAAGSASRAPRFDDPAALDTNQDGEITPDELQQGMRELRIKRHGTMLREPNAGSGD